MQKKTYHSITQGTKKFNFIALPNTNYFMMTLVSHMGSNIERVYKTKTGKTVYGCTHLIEHLAFKSCKDFTTEELLSISKNQGSSNAGTTYDYVDYIFETTMDNCDLAIRVVFNLAFNDFSKLTQEEFETEKMVVINEVKQYMDDDQTMFAYNSYRGACGYEEGDNVLGLPSILETITRDDVIKIKHCLLSNEHLSYNIMYDPCVISEQAIVDKILLEEARFQHTSSCDITKEEYYQGLKFPQPGDVVIENESDQAMTMLMFECEDNAILIDIVSKYFEKYAQESSLDDLIRQKNGLTYGIASYMEPLSHKPYLYFTCDVSMGDEIKLMELFRESIDATVASFTKEKHAEFMKGLFLRKTLSNLNLGNYQVLFFINSLDENVLKPFDSILIEDIDEGFKMIYNDIANYENVQRYMLSFQQTLQEGKYARITNV